MADTTKQTDGHFTLRDATRLAGFGRFQILLLLCLLVFHMTDAMEVLLISGLSEPLACQWHLGSSQLQFITTALFIGMGAAAPLWGKIADLYGRKPILILSTAMIGYFGLLSSFSPTFVWFIFLRLLVGIAIPGAYIAFVILTEFLPKEFKGFTLLLYSLSWPLGGIFETLMTAFVLPKLGWRYLVAFTSIPLWLCLVLTKFIPESPEYLLVSGKNTAVEATVKKMLKLNKKTIPEKFTIVPQPKTEPGKFLNLVKPFSQLRFTLQAWFLTFCLAFLYYGVVLLSSEALRKSYSPCKDYTSNEESCECKVHDWSHYKSLIIASCGEFGGFLLNILFLEALGRKVMMLSHTSLLSVFIFLLHTCTSSEIRSVIQFFIRSFALGAINVSSIYITEAYAPEIRALGYGFTHTAYRIGAMITPTVAQVLTDRSFTTAFTIYGSFAIILVISVCFLPETKTGLLLKKIRKLTKKNQDVEKQV